MRERDGEPARGSVFRFVRALARVSVALSLGAAVVPLGCNAISGIDELSVGVELGDAEITPVADGSREPPWPNDRDAMRPPGDATASDDSSSSKDSGASDARIVVDANKPDVGTGSKIVFASSVKVSGNIGGVTGGDNLCAQAAADAGLSGTWIAWLSTTKKEAIDRITHGGRYVRPDGAEVVANKGQLASSNLTNPISLTEHGAAVDPEGNGEKNIWTGRNASASPSGSSCNDWTSSGATVFGSRGRSGATATPEWTQVAGFFNGGWGCQVPLSLYCFER